MINKEMNTNKSEDIDKNKENTVKLNETGGVYFSSSIKITDPNTNEVLVQIRGDS